jgi:hypothetical protein
MQIFGPQYNYDFRFLPASAHGVKLVQGTRRHKLFPEFPITNLRRISEFIILLDHMLLTVFIKKRKGAMSEM